MIVCPCVGHLIFLVSTSSSSREIKQKPAEPFQDGTFHESKPLKEMTSKLKLQILHSVLTHSCVHKHTGLIVLTFLLLWHFVKIYMKAFILIKLSLCYYHHKEAQKEKLGLIILLLLFPNVVHPTNIC